MICQIKKIPTAILLFILFSLMLPKNIFAAELKYYEFASDSSASLSDSYNVMTQYFKPYDDYVSGFDVWIDNSGNSGTATLELRDSANALLAYRTLTIPHIDKIWGGQRFHIAFSSPVLVSSNSDYKLKIFSSMPKLNIYNVPLAYLLQHNAAYALDKNIGSAYVGLIEQNFIFKFALYEDADITKPIISNVLPSLISSDKIRINFNTNEPVDYKIAWGTIQTGNTQSTSYSGNFIQCHQDINTCFINASVIPDTAYTYSLFIKDAWGNENEFTGSFVSSASWFSQATSSQNQSNATSSQASAADAASPLIYNIRIVSLTDKSVSIAWTTNEAANSSVLIGLNQAGMKVITSVGDAAYELEHFLNSGSVLMPSTSYYASIVSIDPNGNYANQIINFNTNPQAASSNNNQTIQQNNDSQSQNNQNNQTTQQNNSQNQTNNQAQNNNQQANQMNDLLNQENQNLEQNSSQNNSGQSVSVNLDWSSSGEPSANISWNAYGEPSSGYRIDIFSKDKKLKKQVIVSRDVNSAKINGLFEGEYDAIVYKDNEGVFEKISQSKNFIVPSQKNTSYLSKDIFKNPIFYVLIGGTFLIILGAILMIIKKKKSLVTTI